ncbi:HAD-IA family hydrolase [Sphingomonas sp. DBB INV C78]|uniref:HAD-IA family hydrolase n=1 Tax=Sphingomonas sp. DBB INV C78 TaxID=3349434 RepID=UPI0036D33A32
MFDWHPRNLYARLIPDPAALEDFLARVVTFEWHSQHDAGRPFAETSAELAALYPEHVQLIAEYGPRFGETIPGPIPGSIEIVEALDDAGVPLFAITNFSAEFWAPFRVENAAIFDRFRDILVSGEERMVKPDPEIFDLAMRRFGMGAGEALFIDDRADNVAAGEDAGLIGHIFRDAPTLRADLVARGLLKD